MNKKRVLHVLRSNVYSGAENVVCQLINIFKQDYQMFYCSPVGKIEDTLKEKNINYIKLIKFNPLNLRKIVSHNSIDIIHAHDPGACVLASLTFNKKKIIAHVHGNHTNMKSLTLKSVLFLISSMKFDKIIWVSESSLKDYFFYKLIKNKSIILMNIISPEEIYYKSKLYQTERFDCIYLGRLSEEKNPIRAIRIIKDVVKEIPDYRMIFVGDGVLFNECKKYAESLRLENNITFVGYQNNPYPYLYQSDVLLMSSIYEGTPMSALEAMSLGKPIISTPTDGLTDLIKLNETGFYSNDDIEMSRFMKMLKKDRNYYLELSENTRKRFNDLNDLEKYKECMRQIYEE
ncbi:glycosyltransferase [Candidatus Stoquefichus sp. SB1]|uniref:glycosyltransferase n=1 Tax=Candidatus Stoquefichus sp. SB1 TaxID=1658109 RepID=UPI00067EEFA7|nr:glycosyltransferase [Candidatus Stoquefichus sp. SB1]